MWGSTGQDGKEKGGFVKTKLRVRLFFGQFWPSLLHITLCRPLLFKLHTTQSFDALRLKVYMVTASAVLTRIGSFKLPNTLRNASQPGVMDTLMQWNHSVTHVHLMASFHPGCISARDQWENCLISLSIIKSKHIITRPFIMELVKVYQWRDARICNIA